ncbi:MAG: MGMT family protein, partial [Chlamydiota bacterium]
VLASGDVAARIGQPKAARAVGTACRCNPFQLLIPCHRVTASQGKLGGYAAGLDLKKILLEFEGIPNGFQNLQ